MNKITKKILSIISASAIICTASLNAAAVFPGDANDDTIVNSSDALAILNYSVGKESTEKFNKFDADINGDGLINSTDALRVLQCCVGIRKDPRFFDKNESEKYFNETLDNSCSKVKKIQETGSVSVSIYGLGEDVHQIEPIENTTIFNNGTDEYGDTAEELFSPIWELNTDDISTAQVCYSGKDYQTTVQLKREEIDLADALKNPEEFDIDFSELEDAGLEILSGKIIVGASSYNSVVQKNGFVDSLSIYQSVTQKLHVKFEDEEFDIVLETNLSYRINFYY